MNLTDPPQNSQWLYGLAEKDRFGDRIHLGLAISMLFALPAESQVAGVLFGAVLVWYLIRLHFWKKYLLSGPLWVMAPGILWIAVLAVALTWSPDTKLNIEKNESF